MSKQIPRKRVLFVRRFTPALLALLGVFCISVVNIVRATPVASADASNTINFEARLQTASGGIVPDGTYNIEFKLYSASSGGSALWTEDYLVGGTHGLDTRNGYFSSQLGSRTAFPSTINWNQQLWLTMNIGGTSGSVVASSSSSTGWDGEMDPRLQLTAVPYAFQANQLAQYNGTTGYTSNLGIESATGGNQNFIIQDQGAGGTYNLLTQNQADAGYIKLQGGSPSAQTGNISITGTGSFSGGIQTAGNITSSGGSIVLQSSTSSSYATPGGGTADTKINIQNFTPATGGQIVAFGLTSSADSTAKALTIYDARTSTHTPSIDLLSPDETKDFGLTWDGSNTTASLKTSASDLNFKLGSDAVVDIAKSGSAATLGLGIGSSYDGKLQLNNSTNSSSVTIEATGTSSSYTLNLPSATGSSGQCLGVSSVASGVQTLGYIACSTSGGTPFLQGGNSFGATGVLGTGDNNDLQLITNGTARLTVDKSGSNVTLGSGTSLKLQGTAYISNTQGQTNAEAFGQSATVSGSNATALGNGSSATTGGTAVGQGATVSGSNGTAVGKGTAAGQDSIALGNGATTTANNQLVIGSSASNISQVVVGNGVTSATPVGFTLQASSGVGTNINGASVNIAAGQSTGSGNGGSINFQTSIPTTSSSSQNSLATVFSLSGTNGSALFKNGANSTTGFQIQESGSAAVFDVDTTNKRVGIGTNAPSRTFDVSVNTSAVDTPPVLIEQAGAGDVTIELKHTTSSFYIGQDSSNSNAFSINSSAAASSGSSIAYVHSAQGTPGGSGTTITATPGTVTAGNLLVAGFSWTHAAGDGTVTCSDTVGSTFSYYGFNAGGVGQYFESCYAIAAATGSDTISANISTSVNFRRITVAEYSGVDTANPFDAGATASLGGSDPSTSGTAADNATTQTATTTSNGDMIVGLMENTQSSNFAQTAGTGFTQRVISNTAELLLEDKKQSAAGSVVATSSIAGSGVFYEGAILAFRAASAGTVSDTFSNALFSLSQSGALALHNSSDGTAAFRVQNASGSSMFNVDTSGQKVTIGTSGGDTTGTLLVLGNKTSSGDPTEVDGAMYYNSNSNTFRCGEGGVWLSCVGGILTAKTAIGSSNVTTTTMTQFTNASYSIPANYCAYSRVIRLTAYGTYTTTGAATNANLQLQVNYGPSGSTSNVGATTTSNFTALRSGRGWKLDFSLMCPTGAAASSATVTGQGLATFGGESVVQEIPYTSVSSINNTSGTLVLTLSGKWGNLSTGAGTATLQSLYIEGLTQ